MSLLLSIMRKILLPSGLTLCLKATLTFADVRPILQAREPEARFRATLLAVAEHLEEGGEGVSPFLLFDELDVEDHLAWSYLAHESFPELIALDALYPLHYVEPQWTLVDN